MFLQFIDKGKDENFLNGIAYYACGIIMEDHMENGQPNVSGKDYAVKYIDPWGRVNYVWRASGDVEVSPIDEGDYQLLLMAIERLEET